MCFMCLCFGLRSEPTKTSVTGAVVNPDASQQKGMRIDCGPVSVALACPKYVPDTKRWMRFRTCTPAAMFAQPSTGDCSYRVFKMWLLVVLRG